MSVTLPHIDCDDVLYLVRHGKCVGVCKLCSLNHNPYAAIANNCILDIKLEGKRPMYNYPSDSHYQKLVKEIGKDLLIKMGRVDLLVDVLL